MKHNTCTPPPNGLVLEVGSGDHPHPRADVLVDRFLADNTERGGNLVVDRPLIVADAHYLPIRSGACRYVIASHILEHMDDPPRFVRELERVGEGGYIGCPSEIAERLFHWSFHRWYVNLVGDTLVLHPKEPAEPFGELFDYLYKYNPAYWFFQRSMPHLFWVDHEWKGEIKLRLADTSPLNLHDPQSLREIVRPRLSFPHLLVLFVAGWLVRLLRDIIGRP
jgi:SAM-dependent methyltransferase